jgi:hypothetical protein
LSVVAAGLFAQTAWSADSLAKRIEDCARQPEDAARLQCFDRVASALHAGHSDQEAVADRHIAEPSRSAPSEKPREKPTAGEPQALQPVAARVVSLSKTAGRERRIELDNGQVWQENEYNASLMLSPGDSVQIRPGTLRSFLLRAPSGFTTKVRRVR